MTSTINPATAYIPAVPAVEAVPTTVTATLTLHQALIIAALDGAIADSEPLGFFNKFNHHPLYYKYKKERNRIFTRTSEVGKFTDFTGGF